MASVSAGAENSPSPPLPPTGSFLCWTTRLSVFAEGKPSYTGLLFSLVIYCSPHPPPPLQSSILLPTCTNQCCHVGAAACSAAACCAVPGAAGRPQVHVPVRCCFLHRCVLVYAGWTCSCHAPLQLYLALAAVHLFSLGTGRQKAQANMHEVFASLEAVCASALAPVHI